MLAIGVLAFLMRLNRTLQAMARSAMRCQWGVNAKGRIPSFSDDGLRAPADDRAANGIAGAISSISNLLFEMCTF
jgi:hypothetical protein